MKHSDSKLKKPRKDELWQLKENERYKYSLARKVIMCRSPFVLYHLVLNDEHICGTPMCDTIDSFLKHFEYDPKA